MCLCSPEIKSPFCGRAGCTQKHYDEYQMAVSATSTESLIEAVMCASLVREQHRFYIGEICKRLQRIDVEIEKKRIAHAEMKCTYRRLIHASKELSRVADSIYVKMSDGEGKAMEAAWKALESAIACSERELEVDGIW